MGRPVLAYREAGMGGADLHRQVGIAHGVTYLLKGAAGGKHRKGAGEHQLTRGGQARCQGNHVAFRNTAVKKAVGIGLLEAAGLGGGGQVCVQNNQIRVFRTQFHKGRAVAVARCLLHHISH